MAATLNDNQRLALDILRRCQGRWVRPGYHMTVPWQSFHALYLKGLADRIPSEMGRPYLYRFRSIRNADEMGRT